MQIYLPKGYEISEVTDGAIRYVADNMRQSDVDEVMASSGHTPLESLELAVQVSEYANVVSFEGVPFAIGGLVLRAGGIGVPWQLCSNEAPKHRRALVLMGKQGVRHWLSVCQTLVNLVDERNTTSVAWLKHIGFSFKDPVRIGPGSMTFIPFTLSRD